MLAIHDDIQEILVKDYNPFNPPLRDLQELDFYGFISFHPVHWNAVQDLIVQNGGFHTIKLFGAPWMLSYISLKYASLLCTKPAFPVVDAEGKSCGSLSPLRILRIPAEPCHKTCSGGFRQLQTLQIKWTIVRTFLDLSEFAQAIRIFVKNLKQNMSDGPAVDRFGDTRNEVQHRMLCLPKPDDPLGFIFNTCDMPGKQIARELDVYRVCWLAARIFTTHVTFPLPCLRPFRENLLPQLQGTISKILDHQANDNGSNESDVLEILLWCTMIGGIAAEDGAPARRLWYAFQLKRLYLSLNIQSWTRMQELMRSFAWVDVGCDNAGYSLWMEAQRVEDYRAPLEEPCVVEIA
ncbi:hypothetical protein VTN00DRAFT_7710 [Thermoascus crustaceus]|uniref:uncharacterized protein n=1 Tax=Thermoascus crustaceus TaxID=5088 RepID=UPI003743205F